MEPAQFREALVWLRTALWMVENPGRAAQAENYASAFEFLHKHDPDAARELAPDLAALFEAAQVDPQD